MSDFMEGVGCLSVFCEMLHKQRPVCPIKTVVTIVKLRLCQQSWFLAEQFWDFNDVIGIQSFSFPSHSKTQEICNKCH